MKKLKVNFGEGGLQGWLIRHVEKFVLVLFAGVMVWFVVSGSRLEGIKAGQSPDLLRTEAQQTASSVNAARWENVKTQPTRQAQDAVAVTVGNNLDTKADKSKYPLPAPWDPQLIAKREKRRDPRILPPFNLKVVPLYGLFALVPDEADVDPLAPLEAEEEDPKKPGKKPAPKPKKPAAGVPGMPGMPGMPGVPGGAGNKKGKGKGAEPPGMPGMPGMPGLGGEDGEGMQGRMMPGMGGMGGGGKFSESMIIGWRPPNSSTVRIHAANVVMAVVPFEKQTEEFDAKLANSLDHDPDRDRPHYKYIGVQRVDVTDDPSADPSTIAEDVWKAGTLVVAVSLDTMQNTWAGTPNDILDPTYLMPLVKGGVGLTQPLPPFVQRDLYQAMTHPDIPLATVTRAAVETPGARRPKAGEAGGATDDEIPSGGTGVPGAGVPGAGVPGGGAGMAGMAGGPTGMPGVPGGGMKGMPGMAGAAGAGMPAIPGGGMPGMPGMPGMGGGGGYAGRAEALVKYKLVRFVDQNVEKGRKYRYRVKVFVEDPNYPSDLYLTPNQAGLDPVAQVRVQALEAKDAKSGKAKSVNLQSEYSAASDVVTLPLAEWFFAGKVEPETYQVIDNVANKKYTKFNTQAATALVVVQDDKKAVDVPAKWELYKGSAINFTMPEVTVIHPVAGEKRKIEKYSFQTNAVVADMRGGEEIPPIEHSTPFKVPGEILFVDAAGNMHVRDEVDDIEYFHRFVGPEEPQETTKKKPAEGAAPGFDSMFPGGAVPGGMPGAGSMPGIPGGSPGGKPKPKR